MPKFPLAKLTASEADDSVFLNVPYSSGFAPQFLAYICGICAFGLIPRVTLELQGGVRRLDRIVSLIESCRYAIHDMSLVVLDATPPSTPRFNLPFELGLSVLHGLRSPKSHTWFVFESTAYRIQKSLSDLNGTDPYPSVKQMRSLYDQLTPVMSRILTDAVATDLFNARAFRDIVVFTTTLAQAI